MNTAKNFRQLFILVLLSNVLLVNACSRTLDKDGVSSEVTDKGISLRIGSNKETYQPGDTVFITVAVENLTTNPMEYILWNIGDPVIYVFLENTPYANGHNLYEKDYEVKQIQPLVTGDVLPAKQSLTRQVVWDQQIHTYPDPIQAPTGSYTIRCEFFAGSYFSGQEPIKLTTSIEIQVQNAWEIVKPGNALEIARNVPDVASWYAEHSGSNYEPDNNVLMVGNTWEVHFFTKFGATPNEMIVKIEPTTGKVLSYESGE